MRCCFQESRPRQRPRLHEREPGSIPHGLHASCSTISMYRLTPAACSHINVLPVRSLIRRGADVGCAGARRELERVERAQL
eukprot:1742214-Rhodomonas_salina.1